MMSKLFEKDPTEQFMMVPNSLIDDLMPTVSPNEWSILLMIYMKTQGDHNNLVQIPVDQFKEKTGIKSEITIRNAINQLCEKEYLSIGQSPFKPHKAVAIIKTKPLNPFLRSLRESFAIGAEDKH